MPAIVVVGDRNPRYETHRGIDRVLDSLPVGLGGAWHATDALDTEEVAAADGVWMAPGTPYCSFGLDPSFEEMLTSAGLVVSGHAPDAGVEIVELPGHPFYVGTMFQPQMSPAGDGREHPLIEAFFAAARAERTAA